MITFNQKEYTSAQDVISKVTEALDKEKEFGYEVSDKISKDSISISGGLGNIEIWIPEELETTQYSIDDFLREMLPYIYTNTRYELGLLKMSVRGRLTQAQYLKLVKFIIKEAEFVVLVNN